MQAFLGLCNTSRLGVKTLRNKNQTGFTLIELLVVIAIIGLLASVVLLALNSARAKSRDAKRLADVRQISSALELYFNDHGGYPDSANLTSTNAAALVPTYLGQWPAAPTPPDGSGSVCTPANNRYNYVHSGTLYASSKVPAEDVYPSFELTFCLGDATGGYSSGSRVLSPRGIQ